MSETPDTYEPKSTLDHAARVGLQAGAVGLLLSSIQNALGNHSHGAMGVLTRTGGTIGFFSMLSPLDILTWVADVNVLDSNSRNGSHIRIYRNLRRQRKTEE